MNNRVKLLFFFSALLLAACNHKIEPGRSESGTVTVSGLQTEVVSSKAIAGGETFVGTIESLNRGVIAARTDGRIGRLAVKVGDQVKSGQLLLTIEQNTAKDRLAEAQGAQRSAAAQFDLAEKTYTRYEQLARAEAITPQEMDRVAAARETARQAVESANAALAQARTGAGYNQVTAPYAGRVAERLVESGSTVMPGAPLYVIERSGTPQALINLPESMIGQVTLGEEFQIEVPALNRTLTASVVEIQPVSDTATRSFAVRLKLPDDNTLAPGLYLRAMRKGTESQALLVPLSALVNRGQLTGLYVVDGKLLRFRLVKIGSRVGDRVEILSGLSDGETIVTSGVQKAVSGARIEG